MQSIAAHGDLWERLMSSSGRLSVEMKTTIGGKWYVGIYTDNGCVVLRSQSNQEIFLSHNA